MATCPRCLGPLSENHRCAGRGLRAQLVERAVTLGVGGGVGLIASLALLDQPAAPVVLVSAVLGAVLAQALRRAVGPRW